tara:strand:- start:410 stop:811 length:402 start_codon:yes stop_codon:yes gene_type:complete
MAKSFAHANIHKKCISLKEAGSATQEHVFNEIIVLQDVKLTVGANAHAQIKDGPRKVCAKINGDLVNREIVSDKAIADTIAGYREVSYNPKERHHLGTFHYVDSLEPVSKCSVAVYIASDSFTNLTKTRLFVR